MTKITPIHKAGAVEDTMAASGGLMKICPLQSGAIVPFETPNQIATPGGKTALAPIQVPCARDTCAWWDSENMTCCVPSQLVRAAIELRGIKDLLTPPSTGSPIMRLANAIEELLKQRKV